ncbi:MAG TPA: vitamin K epoxide reductase family protein [Candidatus Saccharimonadales bacterium]|nr:vitamin K epoxide reductase family protein [Candidatus Saccharimonadales bacterium]HVX57632.1 vitamin K epoxide reductase family protein [Candidatus Saccharimonadales bacterium]
MRLKNVTLKNALPWILLIGGIIGYICAFIIMNDKVKLANNPNYVPSCSLNPVISCGSVMKSAQAHAFGFPNPFIGLGAFPAVAVVGGAMLAGARFKKWFWRSLFGGYLLGTIFAYWLLFESVYRIKALCPYCLGIDVVVTITFWYLKLYMIDQKYLPLPKRGKPKAVYGWIRRHHLDILVAWFIIVIALILKHFWYYYGKHL